MTGAQRVLQRLKQGPASHLELYRLGVIAHSRIAELRARGHAIACERDGDLYIYRLLGDGPGTDRREKTAAGYPEKARGEKHGTSRVITEQSAHSLNGELLSASPPVRGLLTSSPASHLPLTPRDAGQLNLLGEPAATNRVVEGAESRGIRDETQGDAARG